MPRRTKIIATIGPASEGESTLRGLIRAGMDIARINLSHESIDLALERYRRIRTVAADLGREVGILADLPGPKVRVGHMPINGLILADGQELFLTPGNGASDAEVIEVDYPELLEDVREGDLLVFGDGAVQVRAQSQTGDRISVRVVHGGRLSGRPGLHIPSDRLRLSTPTPEDFTFVEAFTEVGVDFLALSFVRSADDIRRLACPPNPEGPLVVAKIETRQAVENLDAIVEAAGAVMVARGDLGSEFPIEELPHLQKTIIRRCIAVGRPVITATQMLESMIDAPTPTRAEASDVANAVFDGSSTVMLSGETAIGIDPANVVGVMSRIAARADDEFDYAAWPSLLSSLRSGAPVRPDEAITNAVTSAAQRAANEIDAAAIICISQTGFTVRSVARYRPRAKILAFSPDPRTVKQLSMSWGTTPYLLVENGDGTADERTRAAIDQALANGDIVSGDLVVVIVGSSFRKERVTDTVRIIQAP